MLYGCTCAYVHVYVRYGNNVYMYSIYLRVCANHHDICINQPFETSTQLNNDFEADRANIFDRTFLSKVMMI